MKKLRAIAAFFIYSNLFISACALSLTAESFYFLRLPGDLDWYLVLVAAGTVFIYGLHYLAKSRANKSDQRLEWTRRKFRPLAGLTAAGALVSLYLVLKFVILEGVNPGLHAGGILAAFVVTGSLALLYSHRLLPGSGKSIRQLGGLKLVLLSGVWTLATLLLPLWLSLQENGTTYSAWQLAVYALHRFIFIAMVAFLFNLNDYEEDRQDGIRTLAVLAGPDKSRQAGQWVSLALNTLMALWVYGIFPYRGAAYAATLALPVIILFFQYRYFRHDPNDATFVFLHDGLLLLKALLLIFAVSTFNG